MAKHTNTHYWRDLSESDTKRFWAKVDVRGVDDCWNWTAAKGNYGTFSWQGRNHNAQRIAFLLGHKQDIPGDLRVLHSCDNKLCCNPAHLSLGTETKNNQERWQRGLVKSWCTPELAERIRAMYASGKSTWQIAKELFGTPVDRNKLNQVGKIVNKKTWN